jgi:hypothetical protein
MTTAVPREKANLSLKANQDMKKAKVNTLRRKKRKKKAMRKRKKIPLLIGTTWNVRLKKVLAY